MNAGDETVYSDGEGFPAWNRQTRNGGIAPAQILSGRVVEQRAGAHVFSVNHHRQSARKALRSRSDFML